MILRTAWKNIRVSVLRSVIFILSIALTVALMLSVFNINQQIENNLTKNSQEYNLVLTPEGSKTQAVMSSIFYTEAPIGNIDYCFYEFLAENAATYGIIRIIPIALGDNIQGFTLVGTEPDYTADYGFKEGRSFDDDTIEIVIGSSVAGSLGLKLGDTVKSSHGDAEVADAEEGHEHDTEFVVVGILDKQNTPVDNAVYTDIANIWHVHEDHDHEEGEEGHEHEEEGHEHEEGDVTSILIKATFNGMSLLQSDIDNGTLYANIEADHGHVVGTVMASSVDAVFRDLLTNVGMVSGLIEMIMFVVVLLSLVIIFLIVFSSINERKKELAILRAVGFSRGQSALLIILENLILTIIGLLAAFILSRAILLIGSVTIATGFGAEVGIFLFTTGELLTVLAAPVLVLLASIAPIVMVYKFKPMRYLR